jgi:methionyl-tRNA formyltransferase
MSRRHEMKRDLDRGNITAQQRTGRDPRRAEARAREMLRRIERELGADALAQIDAKAKEARRP